MTRLTAPFFFFLFLFCSANLSGQSGSMYSSSGANERDWQFNYHIGFTQFYGDASNNSFFTKLSGESAFGTGFNVRKFLSPSVAVGAGLLYSGVKSHKVKSATGAIVDFNLTGNYYDFGVHLYTDLSNVFFGSADRLFNLYGTIGIGYAGWTTELADNLAGTIVYSGDVVNGITTKKSGAVVPIALGVNYKVGPSWSINFESNFRTVLNDDVDVWAGGFQFDQLLYTHIGISYFINSGNARKQKVQKVRGERPMDCNKPAQKSVELDHIPLYDYKKQPAKPGGNSGGSNVAPMVIDQPIQPVQTYTQGIIYRVQVLAKSQALPSVSYIKTQLGLSDDVYENFQDGVYRYSVGSFADYQSALAYAQELKRRGIHDAFVVVYQNNKRIKLSDNLKK